jgi:ribosomal protein L5
MYVAEKKLIDHLIQHCKNTLPNDNALLLLEKLLKCKAAVNNHRNLRNNSIEEFGNYSKQLDKISNDLTIAFNELRATQKY